MVADDERRLWHRVPDTVSVGRRSMRFASIDGGYTIEIDDAHSEVVFHRKGDVVTTWWIVRKDVCDGIFRLSGPAVAPDAWYELTLSTPAKIVYWPDQTIGEISHEIAPFTADKASR